MEDKIDHSQYFEMQVSCTATIFLYLKISYKYNPLGINISTLRTAAHPRRQKMPGNPRRLKKVPLIRRLGISTTC
jgi:hypothetical protein